jgi:ABC-type phosphate/phosphonate transport system substrate-binding protein
MTSPVLVGAVIYDPKVALIWETISDFFRAERCPIDCVFYTNYELMVDALLAGHIQIAWNSPLAWVDAQRRSKDKCRAIAMRDTDRDRVSHVIVRKGAGIAAAADLRGKTLATGAKDSPQATLLPIHLLMKHGVTPSKDFQVRRFDLMVGKHGDHIGGEREALRSLENGESDAAAMLDLNWQRWTTDGTIDPSAYQVLLTTEPFDHCNFTVADRLPADVERRWTEVLLSMRYDNPAHREMMDMEGLTAWLPGRTSGYVALTEAVAQQDYFR